MKPTKKTEKKKSWQRIDWLVKIDGGVVAKVTVDRSRLPKAVVRTKKGSNDETLKTAGQLLALIGSTVLKGVEERAVRAATRQTRRAPSTEN